MKNNFKYFTAIIIASFLSQACQSAADTATQVSEDIVEVPASLEMEESLLRHMVIFKFKDSATEEDINKINTSFNALPEAIPEIKDFEWGLNDSPENFDQDFTHCYLLSFASEEDRDSIYTPHPQHQAFVASLQPHLEKVFVVDYWTEE